MPLIPVPPAPALPPQAAQDFVALQRYMTNLGFPVKGVGLTVTKDSGRGSARLQLNDRTVNLDPSYVPPPDLGTWTTTGQLKLLIHELLHASRKTRPLAIELLAPYEEGAVESLAQDLLPQIGPRFGVDTSNTAEIRDPRQNAYAKQVHWVRSASVRATRAKPDSLAAVQWRRRFLYAPQWRRVQMTRGMPTIPPIPY